MKTDENTLGSGKIAITMGKEGLSGQTRKCLKELTLWERRKDPGSFTGLLLNRVSGKIMEGNWKDGAIHGEGRVFNPKTEEWKNYLFERGKKVQSE